MIPNKIKRAKEKRSKIKRALMLRKQGYSLREIALLLGYKNHNSVSELLK